MRVEIRHCPLDRLFRAHAAALVSALRAEPHVEVAVVGGDRGEFTVSVDGQEVDAKVGWRLPSVCEVLAVVRAGARAPAESGPENGKHAAHNGAAGILAT
jgi:hypothetical protein